MVYFVTQRYESILEFPEYLYEIPILMEIKDIIKEEFQKFLNEGYVMEHDNFKFRQEIKNSGFYNYENFSNDFDVDINESDIIINWRIGFWLNDTGVENFLVQADSVEGTYKVVLLDKQTDEVSQEIDKNIAEIPWKFQILEANLKLGDTLYIDFKTKICAITFYDTNNSLNEGFSSRLNESREHYLDYFKTMWSQSEDVKKLIFGNNYMFNKYGKYIDPKFDWDSLTDEQLKWVWDEWGVDEQALHNLSKLD